MTVYLIFLQVFDVSCFNLGSSIESPEPLLHPPRPGYGRKNVFAHVYKLSKCVTTQEPTVK